jgi:hypothetical protein
MCESERREFQHWYVTLERTRAFVNRRALERYCLDDVTMLREACRIFRREFLEIGNAEVFLDYLTIASACKRCFERSSSGRT